jgi:hypothetical protein
MLKTLSILTATLALATPALAETVTHRGVTYTYAVADGGTVKVITGTDSRGSDYSLRVKNGWVEGTVNGNPVSFSTRDAVRLRPTGAATEVATR